MTNPMDIRTLVRDAALFVEEQKRLMAQEATDAVYIRDGYGAYDLVERFSFVVQAVRDIDHALPRTMSAKLRQLRTQAMALQNAMAEFIADKIVQRDAC